MEDGSKKVSRRELYDEEGRLLRHLKFVHGSVRMKSKGRSPYYLEIAPVKLAYYAYGIWKGPPRPSQRASRQFNCDPDGVWSRSAPDGLSGRSNFAAKSLKLSPNGLLGPFLLVHWSFKVAYSHLDSCFSFHRGGQLLGVRLSIVVRVEDLRPEGFRGVGHHLRRHRVG